MKMRLTILLWPFAMLCANLAFASPVSKLEVRITTGGAELAAGSDLELRIYEVGGKVRRLPLVHGEAWLPDSTHLIPLALNESLDTRNVVRLALRYRAANPLSPALEIVSADVELPSGGASPQRLLDATLTGLIPREGELASADRDQSTLQCVSDADCDDHKMCNGQERCAPRSAGADARGCVKGAPMVCPVNQICGEGIGCHGTDALRKFNGDKSAATQ
ncbi:MAG TPA: hypothetical protein VGI93_18075 [Steroidobacteraceae bacterium]|jgi:hypothetical protein